MSGGDPTQNTELRSGGDRPRARSVGRGLGADRPTVTSYDLRDNGRVGDEGALREGRPRSGGVRGVNCVGTRYQSSNNSTAGEADVEAGAASLARRIRVMICTRSTQTPLALMYVTPTAAQ